MVFKKACVSSVLTRKSDEKSENVIRALEDPKDPQVPHDLLQPGLPHVAHAAHDLDALVDHEPGRLRANDLGDGGLEVVVLVTWLPDGKI